MGLVKGHLVLLASVRNVSPDGALESRLLPHPLDGYNISYSVACFVTVNIELVLIN